MKTRRRYFVIQNRTDEMFKTAIFVIQLLLTGTGWVLAVDVFAQAVPTMPPNVWDLIIGPYGALILAVLISYVALKMYRQKDLEVKSGLIERAERAEKQNEAYLQKIDQLEKAHADNIATLIANQEEHIKTLLAGGSPPPSDKTP